MLIQRVTCDQTKATDIFRTSPDSISSGSLSLSLSVSHATQLRSFCAGGEEQYPRRPVLFADLFFVFLLTNVKKLKCVKTHLSNLVLTLWQSKYSVLSSFAVKPKSPFLKICLALRKSKKPRTEKKKQTPEQPDWPPSTHQLSTSSQQITINFSCKFNNCSH